MKAQSNYTFDYRFLIKSSLSAINKSQFLISSENQNHIMYQYQNKTAKIFDNENNKFIELHHKTEFDKNIYQFISSQKLTGSHFIIDNITVEKIGENKYLIKCFRSFENIKQVIKITVKLKPWDKDLIRFYYSDLGGDVDKRLISSLKEKLNGNYHYIIESHTIDYKNGFKMTNSIKEIEKIKLQIAFQN